MSVDKSRKNERSVPIEVLGFNDEIARTTKDLPPLWQVGPVEARAAREAGQSVFGPLILSERATTRTIEGSEGPVLLRIIRPETVRGVYLHIHGGGWVLGAAHHIDPLHDRMADASKVAVVSVDYRLAPEHPYPAGPDDCEAAALWLVENSDKEFGTDRLAIGGESAGAHLAAVTMLRLRDRHRLNPFAAAILSYGCFDLRGTPSLANYGAQPLILNTPVTRWFVEQFVPKHFDLANPDISPLFADLAGLPPALFTVGDRDPLIDDSSFMAARWARAGNLATLDIWPGAIHAFDYFDNAYGRAARDRVHQFLDSILV